MRPHARARFRQHGLSLVELMVGVAIGLFIVGGAIRLFVGHLVNNRSMLLETRLNQDLRAAADIVARDLRRAGYWSSSLSGVIWPAPTNPYRAVTASVVNAASQAAYSYNAPGFTGFRVGSASTTANALQVQIGGNWQELTDSNTVRILQFSITPDIQQIWLGSHCTPACAPGSAGCPVLNVRRFTIRIQGQAVSGGQPVAGMVRQIEESMRVRNDEIPTPACP